MMIWIRCWLTEVKRATKHHHERSGAWSLLVCNVRRREEVKPPWVSSSHRWYKQRCVLT